MTTPKTNGFDRWSFLGILESEGVAMYLDVSGNLRSRGKVTDHEIAGWIRTHRRAIIGELENRRDGA